MSSARDHLRAVEKPSIDTRLPPYNLEAELATLGVIFLQPGLVDEVFSVINSPDAFYPSRHQVIFSAARELHEEGMPTDVIHVAQKLRARGELENCGGLSYLSDIGDRIPHAGRARHYAQIVMDRFVARRLIDDLVEVTDLAYQGEESAVLLDRIENGTSALRLEQATGAGLVPVGTVGQAVFQQIEAMYHGKQTVTGISTGLTDLDKQTGGLQRQDLIILGGRPSMGKTALALQIGTNAALLRGEAVAIFSLEMSHEQLYKRQLANLSGVAGNKLFGREAILEADLPRLAKAATDLHNLPLHICEEGNINLAAMRAELNKFRKELAKQGKVLGLVIVDYLQIMGDCSNETREREIGVRSSGLKQIAKEYNAPVIALSQLNRDLEKRPDKRPKMSDLRESGNIEQDADVILFAYRDEVYNELTDDRGVMECIIGKQRNGPVGTVRLRFKKDIGRIEDLYLDNDSLSGQ